MSISLGNYTAADGTAAVRHLRKRLEMQAPQLGNDLHSTGAAVRRVETGQDPWPVEWTDRAAALLAKAKEKPAEAAGKTDSPTTAADTGANQEEPAMANSRIAARVAASPANTAATPESGGETPANTPQEASAPPGPDPWAAGPDAAQGGAEAVLEPSASAAIDIAEFAPETAEPAQSGSVDIAEFMVDDEEAELLGGEQPWDEVPVSKPGKKGAILVHPDEALRAQLLAYEDDEGMEKTYYLVTKAAGAYIPELVGLIIFVPYITPKGTVKLWPIKAKRDAKGQMNRWSRTALNICNKYAGQWVRVIPDDGFYRAQLMKMNHEPAWPAELSRDALIDRAFADNLIRTKEHPIVQHMLKGG